jgi:peptide chain release factor subunit 3
VLSTGYECVIHLHSIVDGAEIVGIEAVENAETKKMVKTTFLRSGQVGIVRVKVNSEVCLEKFDFMESLGRFTLRDEGKYIKL